MYVSCTYKVYALAAGMLGSSLSLVASVLGKVDCVSSAASVLGLCVVGSHYAMHGRCVLSAASVLAMVGVCCRQSVC